MSDIVGFLLYQFPVCDRGTRLISWLSLGGILMPIGILGEVVLGTSPIFVLVGATSMTVAMVLYGFALWRHSPASEYQVTSDNLTQIVIVGKIIE